MFKWIRNMVFCSILWKISGVISADGEDQSCSFNCSYSNFRDMDPAWGAPPDLKMEVYVVQNTVRQFIGRTDWNLDSNSGYWPTSFSVDYSLLKNDGCDSAVIFLDFWDWDDDADDQCGSASFMPIQLATQDVINLYTGYGNVCCYPSFYCQHVPSNVI